MRYLLLMTPKVLRLIQEIPRSTDRSRFAMQVLSLWYDSGLLDF